MLKIECCCILFLTQFPMRPRSSQCGWSFDVSSGPTYESAAMRIAYRSSFLYHLKFILQISLIWLVLGRCTLLFWKMFTDVLMKFSSVERYSWKPKNYWTIKYHMMVRGRRFNCHNSFNLVYCRFITSGDLFD